MVSKSVLNLSAINVFKSVLNLSTFHYIHAVKCQNFFLLFTYCFNYFTTLQILLKYLLLLKFSKVVKYCKNLLILPRKLLLNQCGGLANSVLLWDSGARDTEPVTDATSAHISLLKIKDTASPGLENTWRKDLPRTIQTFSRGGDML